MDTTKTVGQLFMVGFHGLEADEDITTLIREYHVGYVILFSRNVKDAAQLLKLTTDLQRIAKDAGHARPLFIAIDQENGLVTRIKPTTLAQLPGAMAVGASSLPNAALDVARATGEALKALGISMNLSPICDVNSEPQNPVIGVRSPGDEPQMVGSIAAATVKGLQEKEICPVPKHFPGHGDTAVDSHYGLPVIEKSVSAFRSCELVPFQKVVAGGADAMMTAHIAIPAIDNTGLPASLSANATALLRNDLDFQGLLMSDCLEMDGVRAGFGTVKAAEMAFSAGTDCLMVCHTFEVQKEAIQNLANRLREEKVSQQRLEEAIRRTEILKDRYLRWNTQTQDPEDMSNMNVKHADLAKKVYESSITLVRDKHNILPLSGRSRIAFIHPGVKPTNGGAVESGEVRTRVPHTPMTFQEAISQTTNLVKTIRYDEEFQLKDIIIQELKDLDATILVTRNAKQAAYQCDLGTALANKVHNLIVIAVCDPYDFLEDQSVGTYLVTYEPTIEAFAAAIQIILGALPATGHLPVRSAHQ